MTALATVMGWIAIVVLLGLTYAFAHDPRDGLWTQAHRRDRLPMVMATRYVALAALGIGILLAGPLSLLALFFAVAAGLGAADAVVYHRVGGTVWPHAVGGCAGLLAFCVTLAALSLGP